MSSHQYYPELKNCFQRFSWFLIPLVSGLWVARQFSNPHLASCVVDDGILQMSWVRQFSEVLSGGVWIPRWLPDSNGGYGSPVFIFYSPLVYYVSAFFYWLTGSIVFSMKLVRWMGLCLSGFAMLPYARRFASPHIALIVALVYLSLPFHVLDLCYWSLYAGTWAWIWFPLILLFLDQMLSLHAKLASALSGFSLCYAGLILTHLVSAYLFSFVILMYVAFHLGKSGMARVLGRLVLGVSLGVSIAAFFLWPAIVERPFVHLEYNTLLPEFNFRNTFLFFPDPGLMSANHFQARTLQLLRWIALLQAAIVLNSLAIILKVYDPKTKVRRKVLFSVGTMCGCLFMMSSLSGWIWDLVPGLPQIQFSTRWMSILTFASSPVIGLGIGAYTQAASKQTKWLKLGHFSLCVAACLFSVVIVLGGCFLGQDEEKLAAANVYNAPEYNPNTMPNWTQRVIEKHDPPLTVMDGKARVRIDQVQAQLRRFFVEAETSVRLKMRLFDYPGWTIRVNEVSLKPTVDAATGGMIIDLAPGTYDLRIEFTDTWWRRIAYRVSLLTILFVLAYWVRYGLHPKEIPNPKSAKGNLENKRTD